MKRIVKVPKKKTVKKKAVKKVVKKKKKRKLELTPKQKMFCFEYLIDLNATQSAIRAGYSKRNADKIGSELLGKTRVKAYIDKRIEKREKKTEISAEYVINNVKEIGERCMQKVPVMVRQGKDWVQKKERILNEDGTSQIVGVWEFKEAGALKAQELLGKHLKIWTEKVEEKITDRVVYVTPEQQKEVKDHIRDSIV